jgi:tRNA-splicing ligase RtcB
MTLKTSTDMFRHSLPGVEKPHRIYGIEGIELPALVQFVECLDQDFSVYGSAMPDMHLGYTMPIGGVILTKPEYLVPSWVGYDIGCGMYSVRTGFNTWKVKDAAQRIFANIYRRIPVGFKHHVNAQKWRSLTDGNMPMSKTLEKLFIEKKGLHQLGTLGGGNHFIEIGVGMDNRVSVTVHSGSRGIGHAVASHYMREACFFATGQRKLSEGSFPLDGGSMDKNQFHAFYDYQYDMKFCLEFALRNRVLIAEAVVKAIQEEAPSGEADFKNAINKNHNHAEYHTITPWGAGWIHRKGATNAERGMSGVIPGNMRDGVFIVEGRGVADSLYSSSHGAGRICSRVEAGLKKAPMVERLAALDTFTDQMEGIQAKVGLDTLDENPMAYKPILRVLENQRDLCSIEDHIKPIINIKA